MVAAILEGAGVTIDVAKLRSLARYQNDAVITAEEITELLDAYEERDRLRAALDLAQRANRHYASLVMGAALEGRE